MEVCVELMVLVVVVGGGIPSISNSKDIKARAPASQIRIFKVGVSFLPVVAVAKGLHNQQVHFFLVHSLCSFCSRSFKLVNSRYSR